MRFCVYSDVTSHTLALYRELIDGSPAGEEVEIEICSAGGDVFTALGIIDLNTMQKRATRAVVLGWAASAAALIALSCDHVTMTGNGSMLLHSVWADGGIDDDTKRYINARQLAVINRRDPSYTMEDLSQERWLDAQECADRHFADDVIRNSVAMASARYAAYIAKHSKKEAIMPDVKDIKAECGSDDDRKISAAEGDIGEAVESDEKKTVDVLEQIVERLDRIEHRVAVLEGEGKKADDEEAVEAGDVIAARINKLYARLAAKDTPCAPRAGTKEQAKSDAQASLERSQKYNLNQFLK